MSDFGDRVRVKQTPETSAAEVANMEGDVHGFTTPSVTGVSVIGGAPDDHAINVYFQALSSDRWFRPDLLEFLHHNAGTEVVVGNVKAVRQSDGSWVETRAPSTMTLLDRLRCWFKQ
jgi:hypothetical protein